MVEEKNKSGFELGNTKIYVSSQTLRYCSIRKLIQIGCFNSRTEDLVHLASQPGPLKQFCSKHFLQYLKWRDIDKEKPWFRKEGDVKLECVPDILQSFLSLIEKETKLNPVTLVFYSTAEYHELAYMLKLNKQLEQDFKKNVKSIVIYEYYKYKANEKSSKAFEAIDILLDIKIRVYSCDKLAELLRQLFVESKKKEEDYYPLKPDFDKIPKIQVSYPRLLWNMQPKYLLLSSIRVTFNRTDWKEEVYALPREAYKKVFSMLDSPNNNCVSAFRSGIFRFNQPIIVKFKGLKEETKSISYKGKILESYLANGACSLYTYNTVQFGIVVFQYDNQGKFCTDSGDIDYLQHKGVVDNELDVYGKVFDQDQPLLDFAEMIEDDFCGKEDNRKFDLVVADILDRKKNVAIRKTILKSVLIKLTPIGGGDTKEDVSVSVHSIFMAFHSSFKHKGLKIVNQIFCPVRENSNLVRLVLTSTGDDFNLEEGKSIGMATPINQSNFSEALIQAFQHEIDVTEFIIDTIKKRRLREGEESGEKKNTRKNNKRPNNKTNLQDPKQLFSNKKKPGNNKVYDTRDDRYGKRDEQFGCRDEQFGSSRDEKYGRKDDKYGSRDETYGKRDEKYGKRDEKYGKDEIFGSRDELYGSVDNQEVNLSDLGVRRKDLEQDLGVRRKDHEHDLGARRNDLERHEVGRDDWYRRDQGRERNKSDSRGQKPRNDHQRDSWQDSDYNQQNKRPESDKWYEGEKSHQNSRGTEDYQSTDRGKNAWPENYSDRPPQDSSRQTYTNSEYPLPSTNNFTQPPPPLGTDYIETVGQRRY